MKLKSVLSIAGSDCSGGAGIQADLKTIAAHHLYGMSVLTALTAQNTTGVTDIFPVTPEFLESQLDAVFTDIFPDSVKIGMVAETALIQMIAKKLTQYQPAHIVLDPVMVSTSGHALIDDDAKAALTSLLFPLAEVITPNIPEAEVLTGRHISSKEEMEAATRELSSRYSCAVLLKGGHNIEDANDVLCEQGVVTWFASKRIANPNTHGTGCTLSSAIACELASGKSLPDAIGSAKAYLSGALGAMLDLGKGSGPLDHAWNLEV